MALLRKFPFWRPCVQSHPLSAQGLFATTCVLWYFVPKILPTYCKKKCSSDQEKLLKYETEGREFVNVLRSLEQFIWTVKSQNNFWERMLFKIVPGQEVYRMQHTKKNYDSKWKKILGYRNLHEKLEKQCWCYSSTLVFVKKIMPSVNLLYYWRVSPADRHCLPFL